MLNRKIDTRPILQRVVKSTPALWQYGGKGFAGVMANIKRPAWCPPLQESQCKP